MFETHQTIQKEGTAMELSTAMLAPWMNIRLPASGDVSMNYNPWTNWGMSIYDAGDPEIEREIFTKVALPGRQLGRLNDAVMALIELVQDRRLDLAEARSDQKQAIESFVKLASEIRIKKRALQGTVEANAETALDRLKAANIAAYDELIGRQSAERARERATVPPDVTV